MWATFDPRRIGVVKLIAVIAVAAAVAAGGAVWAQWDGHDAGPAVTRTDQMIDGGGVSLDTSYFTAEAAGKRPAVLLAHGFGGSKSDLTAQAESLARQGYAVLTYTARGFGNSSGKIGLNALGGEVADASRLVDWLAARPQVQLDAPGDPRIGVAGGSYGGALALELAGTDPRVDAIAPRVFYWDLNAALFPGGVFKKLWAAMLVTTAGGCDRLEPELCDLYTRAAQGAAPTDADRALLAARSPVTVGREIRVPTLLAPGQTDSLFPLGQADAAAAQIAANGAPVAVDWIAGGHDGGDAETARLDQRTLAWFDHYLRHEDNSTGPAFRISRVGGIDTADRSVTMVGAHSDHYPGLGGDRSTAVELRGGAQSFANPAGGLPPSISSVPGLGALSSLTSIAAGLGGNAGGAGEADGAEGADGAVGIGVRDLPGQSAAFVSEPLAQALTVTGSPEVTLTVESSAADAVLLAKLYDAGPDGAQVLPRQLATPIRVRTDGRPAKVTVRLPAIDHEFAAGHRLKLVLASTDLGYLTPTAPATYRVSAPSALTLPSADLITDSTPLPRWVWAAPLVALALAAAIIGTARRRRPGPADPSLTCVPLTITGLSKRYAGGDGYSVRDLDLRVERGQVLGLLGPNGAGKTTTLRMLMGLIIPDAGEIRVFGQPVTPGAPVLSRLGAFVEGAGFLPHLTGRANLDLYWRATGRPAADSHLEQALAIADLGTALDRAVRTYSQGMRQRLAIAQAMLGLPEVLVLDEPTNGLDPSQIRAMREAIAAYGATGRTVIVSSHLLSEVEQVCTHLLVLDRGQLVTTGTVGDVVGPDGRNLEEAFLAMTGGAL